MLKTMKVKRQLSRMLLLVYDDYSYKTIENGRDVHKCRANGL